MARTKGDAAELERRRDMAIRMIDEGMTQAAVARVVKVHVRTVARWVQARRDSRRGLKAKPRVGSPTPRKLSDSQLLWLSMLLKAGPGASGYVNEIWTLKRVCDLVFKTFGGVLFSISGMRHVLRQYIGFSCQKPSTKNEDADDAEIARWRGSTWEAIKKKPSGSVDTLFLSMNPA